MPSPDDPKLTPYPIY
jgi:hypothetical protein